MLPRTPPAPLRYVPRTSLVWRVVPALLISEPSGCLWFSRHPLVRRGRPEPRSGFVTRSQPQPARHGSCRRAPPPEARWTPAPQRHDHRPARGARGSPSSRPTNRVSRADGRTPRAADEVRLTPGFLSHRAHRTTLETGRRPDLVVCHSHAGRVCSICEEAQPVARLHGYRGVPPLRPRLPVAFWAGSVWIGDEKAARPRGVEVVADITSTERDSLLALTCVSGRGAANRHSPFGPLPCHLTRRRFPVRVVQARARIRPRRPASLPWGAIR